jgi:hypothetical protein
VGCCSSIGGDDHEAAVWLEEAANRSHALGTRLGADIGG